MARVLADAPANGLPEAAGRYVGTLFDDHGARVFGLCRVLLRDSVEAEDAAQETFLSAYRSLLSGHTPRDPPVWLSAIARNECLARRRARATAQAVPIAEGEPAGDDVAQIASRREQIDDLRDALTELPEPQREAIVLREFYGLSYEEVGAASGLTTSAVKSALFRARKRLKTRLRAPREALGLAILPVALRDSLAQAVPGFASSEAAVGPLAKVAAIPLAAKLAGATVSVAVVGALGGAVAETRDLHAPPTPLGLAAAAPSPAGEPRVPRALPTVSAPSTEPRPSAAPTNTKRSTEARKTKEEAAEGGEVEHAEAPEVEAAEAEHEEPREAAEGEGREHEKSSEDD